jgi:hypothetical protein
MTTANDQFQTLLQAYAESANFEIQAVAEALDFESDGLLVRISVDPSQSARLLVQVVCGSLNESLDSRGEADIALMLHRMNSAAMLEHDWVITIDPARTVRLHQRSNMAQTNAAGLHLLLSEATQRGQALQQMLNQLQQAAQSATTDKPSADQLPLHGMLRG